MASKPYTLPWTPALEAVWQAQPERLITEWLDPYGAVFIIPNMAFSTTDEWCIKFKSAEDAIVFRIKFGV